MKRIMALITTTGLLIGLSACGSTHKDLIAPCTQFGRFCPQIPINAYIDVPTISHQGARPCTTK